MKILYIPAFVLVLLLTQWGSLAHDYHIHDASEGCEYCLSAHAFDHAVSPAEQTFFEPSFSQFQPVNLCLGAFTTSFHYYAARAPPRFI